MAMTNGQKQVAQEFNSNTIPTAEALIRSAIQVKEQIVSLPNTNEDGDPVAHKDNLAMIGIFHYYVDSYNLLARFFDQPTKKEFSTKFQNWNKL